MEFTNREIATYLWLGMLLVAGLVKPTIRKALFDVVRSFFQYKLVILWLSSLAYVAVVVWVLSHFGLWAVGNLKTTALWVVTFVFVAFFDLTNVRGEDQQRAFFWKLLKDTLALSAVLTFLVELYSFSLITELIAVPVLAFLTLLRVVAQNTRNAELVAKMLQTLLVAAGVWYLWYSLYSTISGFDEFATMDNLREFGTPILLSLAFVPFLYFWLVIFTYENTFFPLSWQIEDAKLRRRAKWEAVLRFGPRLERARRWGKLIGSARPKDVQELRRSFGDAARSVQDERNPPIVPPSEGWSPQAARTFLTGYGLATTPYLRSFEEEWSASSPLKSIGESRGLPNNLAYYIAGDACAAKSLKLRLYINRPAEQKTAEDAFVQVATSLLEKALGKSHCHSTASKIEQLQPFTDEVAGTQISLVHEHWTHGIPGGYERTLHIKR